MRGLKEIIEGVFVSISNSDNTIPSAGDTKLNKTQFLSSWKSQSRGNDRTVNNVM